jgi:hypothetical protein
MPDRKEMQKQLERAQQDGLARLRELHRQGQLTDQEYLLAAQRLTFLVMKILLLLDEAYLQVAEYVQRGGQSEHHQALLADRAAYLLRSFDHGIADILTAAISQVKADLPNTRPREKVVREVIVKEVEPS